MAFIVESWFFIWLIIEINLTGLILLLLKEGKKEKTIILFLFQSISSLIILISIFSNKIEINHLSDTHKNIILTALFLKIGLFPFHPWILSLRKSLSWISNFILITWQKFIPILIIIKLFPVKTLLIYLPVLLLSIGLVILKTSNIKIILICSSLIHMGWIITPNTPSILFSLIYLIIYSLILIMIINPANKENFTHIINQPKFPLSNPLIYSIIRIAGIPPLLGFFIKLIVFFLIISLREYKSILITLIIVSSIRFFAYSQIIYKTLIIKKLTLITEKKIYPNKKIFFISINITLPLLIIL